MLAKHHVLNRAKCWILIGGLSASCLGCSVCPSPYDYDYGTYGTKTPRTDMRHGRVGSILSDPVYRGGETLVEPSVMTEGIISEEMISEEIISEGVISGEPQRVLRSPMRAPLRSPLGSQGEIIIE